MFLGNYDHSVDSKGRIVLPKEYRAQLGERFYITSGFENCAQVMSEAEFDRLRERIRELPADKALSLQYLLISPAVAVTPNSQGRIPIPMKLREDCSIKDEVTVVGMDNRIEIWDKDTFAAFMEEKKKASIQEALELLRL